ncbi:uncharacterized protein MKK02DRAFT_41471 [Dioszegia hungarica]|uniref:Uncharacterized protein n=1 Tax=Dioszegia hungarica TaxID=4972 RepID=A0AA38H358_9TREE|nr:uncharacterized protein MKK02DRAFT_41471 [Dioszegia hungarica]KAI9631841.1 hypothetical protein MKK02DRAFT_41471 [Dioszegia hungarica]
MDTALPWQEHTPGYNFFTYVALHDGEHGSTPADQTDQSKVAVTNAAWDLMKAIKKNIRAELVAEAAASEVGIESAAATDSYVTGEASQNSVLTSALFFGVGAAALLGTAHWISSKTGEKSWA